MKNKLLTILLFLLAIITKAQEFNSASLIGSWKLNWIEGGFFSYNDLLFEKSNDSKGQYIFKFKKNGTFKQLLAVQDLTNCPV